MNVIILEDENRAANHLTRLLLDVAPEMIVLAVFETVRDAVTFLESTPDIALIFADVQLADGLSFDIFSQVDVTCPIVFTTAYDTYAIDAFNTNGIDYLLKPIEEERLRQAIAKARKFTNQLDINLLNSLITQAGQSPRKEAKSRFMIKVGERIKSIGVEEILAFYSFEKATYMHTNAGRNYVIDYSLDELQMMLDESRFFKISRKYIVSLDACKQIYAWSNSRLKLEIEGLDDDRIIVSRERVQEFKQWLDS